MTRMRKELRALLRLRRSGEGGQALVETALMMPLFLLLLLGAAEFGQAAYIALEVSNAAKAAAQYGAQNVNTAIDQAGMQAVAQADAALPSGTTLTITASSTCSCSSPYTANAPFSCHDAPDTSCPSGSFIEQTITVEASAPFKTAFTVPGYSNSFTLYGHAVQKRLQ